ncbi:MAG: dihydroorotate dehydrogenase electron transfer subunit [Planctomycetota bacterium]
MPHFADCASSIETPIIENECIAKDTMRIRVCAPEMAKAAVPGQFFMLRNPNGNDPLIGRALALYDSAEDDSGWIDLVYIVKGKLTTSVAQLQPGSTVAVWGPLGNGFPTSTCEHLIMVAGGIGQTPFLTLAKEALGKQSFGIERSNSYARKVTFCYGVRNSEYLAGLQQFEDAGCEVRIASEDGSYPAGYQGAAERVTDVLSRVIAEADCPAEACRIVCCGPEPMMEAVAILAEKASIPCQVSLETPMACGIGICFTCVAKIGAQDDWDYKRTCVEGPVFDASEVQWD